MGGMNELDRYAKQQHGVVSRAQVIAALGSRSSIRWKVTRGELERVHELAYRLRGAAPTWERSAYEAIFIAGKGAVLSHRTAAWLHRLDGFEQPKVIDVATHLGASHGFPGVKFHRSTQGPADPVWCRLLPVSPVQRTIVDLAGILKEEPLELALDSAQRQYKHFEVWLDQYIKQLDKQRTPGLVLLKMLLELRQGKCTDSPLEVRVLRVLRRLGLLCTHQFEVYALDGTYVMRVDFAWPHLKIAVHIDSYRWHHQRERFERDARQRSHLSALGWRTLTITSRSFDEGTWLPQLHALLNPQAELALH